MDRYENDGITDHTIKGLIANFESELFDTGYQIDIKDPDTINEMRRCRCKDIKLLCQVGPLNPSNPLYDNTETCPTTLGGKCGLYTCVCYEESDEWFTGFCSYCDEKIDDTMNAKRIPLASGGFKGCFCSNNCIHECLSDNTAAIEHILVEIMQEYQNIIDTYYMEEILKHKFSTHGSEEQDGDDGDDEGDEEDENDDFIDIVHETLEM